MSMPREYSEHASIQMVYLWIIVCRFVLVLGALCCTIYVIICDYKQWQDSPVVTSLKDTNKQVKDTPFPSVTICTEGINMDAIIDAVNEDFKTWLNQKQNSTKNDTDGKYTKDEGEHTSNIKAYLFDVFSISPSKNISIEDIALAYSSPDPEK